MNLSFLVRNWLAAHGRRYHMPKTLLTSPIETTRTVSGSAEDIDLVYGGVRERPSSLAIKAVRNKQGLWKLVAMVDGVENNGGELSLEFEDASSGEAHKFNDHALYSEKDMLVAMDSFELRAAEQNGYEGSFVGLMQAKSKFVPSNHILHMAWRQDLDAAKKGLPSPLPAP